MLDSLLVKRMARDVGFDDCGIAEAAAVNLTAYDRWIAHGDHAAMAYMERYRHLRSHPANLFPGTRTVVSLLLGYHADTRIPHIAQYAYGEDYHKRLKALLHTLAARLKGRYPTLEARPCVDTAPIPEKYWACQAGLGWQGRNTLLIHPRFGSFHNLGELLLTLPADHYDSPLPNGCPDDCHACLCACPNGALVASKGAATRLSAPRCTAYNTIESQAPCLPADLHTAGYAFGCDLCQLACPYNAHIPVRQPVSPGRAAALTSLPAADEPTFRHVTHGTAMQRISYRQWQRNVGRL